MEYILNVLPDIAVYLVLGFLFCTTYGFVRQQDGEPNYQYIFLKSITWGFILTKIYGCIPSTSSESVDIVIMAMASIISGGVVALFINSWLLSSILEFFEVGRNTNKCIWVDLVHDDLPMRVRVKNEQNNVTYEGRVAVIEESTRKPQILLIAYKEYKGEELINDYSDQNEQAILIDTAQFSEIKIIYNQDGIKVTNWCKSKPTLQYYIRGAVERLNRQKKKASK